jgi:hypothetical protein
MVLSPDATGGLRVRVPVIRRAVSKFLRTTVTLVENPYTKANQTLTMTSLSHREAAEALALEALSFLARDPDRIARFLANAGIGPDQLREAAREPGFLGAVLDHLMSDEPLLLTFTESSGLKPNAVLTAHQILSTRAASSA